MVGKNIIVAVVGVLIVVGFFVCLPMNAQATEPNWLTPGTDMTVTDTSGVGGYIRVSQGDKVSINWKSGTVASGEQLEVCLYTSTITDIAWDGWATIGTDGKHRMLYGEGSSSPASMWVKAGSFDVIKITIGAPSMQTLKSKQTFNITTTPTDLTFGGKDYSENLTRIEQSISNLTADITKQLNSINETLNALQNYTTFLNKSFIDYIITLNESLRENISSINSSLWTTLLMMNQSLFENITFINENFKTNISELRSELWNGIFDLSVYESSDVSRLQAQINNLNSSLFVTIEELRLLGIANDTALMEQLVTLSTLVGSVNDSLNAQITSIPSYNDTLIWNEINNLSERESIIQVNNTTVIQQTLYNQTLLNQTVVNQTLVNETPMKYVNTTFTKEADSSAAIGAAMAGGALTGGCAGIAVATLGSRKKELKPIPPPEEPERFEEFEL